MDKIWEPPMEGLERVINFILLHLFSKSENSKENCCEKWTDLKIQLLSQGIEDFKPLLIKAHLLELGSSFSDCASKELIHDSPTWARAEARGHSGL
ncbi:Protein Elys [Manis pentadactyla]|nr:Protein Elys [Manis pentadactyla]